MEPIGVLGLQRNQYPIHEFGTKRMIEVGEFELSDRECQFQ